MSAVRNPASTPVRARPGAPTAHTAARLAPGIGSRDYLHLAPLSSILREALHTRLAGAELRVLDLGCGGKPYIPLFGDRARPYIGIDVDRGAAADVLGVGGQLPFRDETFDVVLCTQVLEHDPEPQRTVDEARRVLAEGGVLILSTHGVWFKHGGADYWRWTDTGLRRITKSFAAVDIRSCGGQYSCLFQLLNLYADPLPVGRRLAYLVNNLFGLALDRVLPADHLISNYVAIATK